MHHRMLTGLLYYYPARSFLVNQTRQSKISSEMVSRKRLAQLLQDKRTHQVILCLVFLDLTITFTEIILEFIIASNPNSTIDTALVVLWALSLSIISLFAIENILAIYVHRTEFFKSKLHVLDLFVVFTSLVLMLVFNHNNKSINLEELVGLLVALRSWRIVRVMMATAVATNEENQKRIHMLQDEILQLKQQLALVNQQSETTIIDMNHKQE